MVFKLRNYLRTFRKSRNLYQDEIAFLVGSEDGANVSLHESNKRNPGLVMVLCYEVIYGVSIRRLFPGIAQEVREHIKDRAQLLIQKLHRRKQDKLTVRKLQMLKALASGSGAEPDKENEK